MEDPIEKAYRLEVSSPGIDRPLVRKADFTAHLGHEVKIETSVLVADRKRFRGRISGAGPDEVAIESSRPAYGAEPSIRIPYQAISEARLVLTDDLVRDALSRDNKARKEARKRPAPSDGESGAGGTDE